MTDRIDFIRTLTDPDYEPPIYFARDGEPLTRDEWMNLWESSSNESKELGYSYRIVDNGNVNDLHGREHFVSTVWLGLDHGFGAGPPVIFETMVFCHGHTCSLDDSQWRYCTEAEAEAGHAKTVAAVREHSTPLLSRIGSVLTTYWEWVCFWADSLKRKLLRRPEPVWQRIHKRALQQKTRKRQC